jgi:hypothetical protein
VAIYGTTYEEHKQEFIDELMSLTQNLSTPILFGGDINLVRGANDKNNGIFNFNWVNKFNNWINSAGPMKIQNSSRRITWTNNQLVPIMANIDRIYASTCWRKHFPSTTDVALARPGSDHTPLFFSTGDSMQCPRSFRFEKWWLEIEECAQIVPQSWNLHVNCTKAVQIWQTKQRRLRKTLKGWSINTNATQKKYKQQLVVEYDCLDTFGSPNLFL